jgi:transketolase
MPCWEAFAAQDAKYRRSVLPPGPVRVAVEAAAGFGWERWLCGEGGSAKKAAFVGMSGFGASGPIEAVYPHFGITAEAVAAKAESLL